METNEELNNKIKSSTFLFKKILRLSNVFLIGLLL